MCSYLVVCMSGVLPRVWREIPDKVRKETHRFGVKVGTVFEEHLGDLDEALPRG